MIAHKNHWNHHWVLLAIGMCLLVSVATGTIKAEENPDAIPVDGTAKELLEYVNRQLGWGMPVPDNDAERKEQVEKLERSLEAINLGLERVSDDDDIEQPGNPFQPRLNVRTALLEKKVFVLWLLDEYAEGYAAAYLDFMAELEANPADREIAIMARARYLSNLAGQFRKTITKEKFFEYQKQVQDFLQDSGDNYVQSMALDLLHAAIRLADQENDRTIATEAAALCTALFENAKDDFNRSLAYRPTSILNKHYLAEDGLQIQGKLFSGELFDLAVYRGRPMLVVFWRSDPQEAEKTFSAAHASNLVFPKLKEIYEQYHDRGLKIVGVCTDKRHEDFPAPEDLLAMLEHSFKTAESLPWPHNISEKLTTDAGMASNEKKYDLWGEYIFFLDTEGRVRHQQPPNCADFDSANAKGVNISGMAFGGPMKYLTEELEQKIKDHFSGNVD